MSFDSIPIRVRVGNREITTVYLSRVPCVGEVVRIVDPDVEGTVIGVVWVYDDGAALINREVVTLIVTTEP